MEAILSQFRSWGKVSDTHTEEQISGVFDWHAGGPGLHL